MVISDDIGAAQAVPDVPVDERAVRYLEAGAPHAHHGRHPAQSERDPDFPATVDTAVRTALTDKARAGLLPEA